LVSVLALAAELCQPAGTLLVLGIPEQEEARMAPLHKVLVSRDLTFIGSVSNTPADFHRAIETLGRWKATRKTLLDELVGHRIPFSEYERALREAATGDWPKVILEM